MRKGITPIIAEIILLLMTVALVGSAWLFLSGQFTSMTSKVIEAGPLAAPENSVIVFNRGMETIKADEISISVDGNQALILNPQPITAGGSAIFYFIPRIAIQPDVWELGPFKPNVEVRVASPTNVVSYRTELDINTVNNLVRNPGFEQGVNVGWINTWPSFFNNQTQYPRGGSISANATGIDTLNILVVYSSDYIPYNPNIGLNIELYAKSNGTGGLSRLYAGFIEYDKDKNYIAPWHVYYFENTKTTLAANLNPGDTQVQLTNSANWYNGAISYYRVIGFWNTGDYPPYTYTRTLAYYSGVSGNALTLCSWPDCLPVTWTDPIIPAGTPVANMFSGSSFNYVAAEYAEVPVTWTKYSGSVTGWVYGQATSHSNLRYGTEYAVVLLLTNYVQEASYTTLFDDFRVWAG